MVNLTIRKIRLLTNLFDTAKNSSMIYLHILYSKKIDKNRIKNLKEHPPHPKISSVIIAVTEPLKIVTLIYLILSSYFNIK
ncbi:hypothetical protein NUSPORA_00818 [Nucleospora cyclopteri]